MDHDFLKNKLNPGDPGFRYDLQKDFDPEESNDWDKSQSGASISQKPSGRSRDAPKKSSHSQPAKPPPQTNTRLAGDEEFDIDFDEDFNDDLDDFED